jgi:uncharacterized protein (TIGR00304 family)
MGIILLITGIVAETLESSGSNSQFGGVIMIGPFPITFGSSPEISSTMLFVGAGLFIAYILLWRRAY